MTDYAYLFEQLVLAETEEGVEKLLHDAGYLTDDSDLWKAYGHENNFAQIGNQQSDPTGAFVEKIINSIDAMLLGACYQHQINPEGPQAPQSMIEAVDRFFGVRDGRLNNLSNQQLRDLATHINVVAVGSKDHPNYLIADRGEGQTPAKFPNTFLSLTRSNKIHIPFVQGKFNSGGTGVLQFCGTGKKNYQLIVSRRQPGCPVDPDDSTWNRWGFTIVRRLLPANGRRSSMYVYLAPGGEIPSFEADTIRVLPGPSGSNRPATPYAVDLPYGTCIKLYDYRWKAKSLFTLEGRYELEKFLQTSCLPFRLTEAREVFPKAHYYSTTVKGGWLSATETEEGESKKLEDGFPAYAGLHLEGIGTLPYQLAVFKPVKEDRRIPRGVLFVINGQVHGGLPADFVSRKLNFDYLTGKRGPLLVLVDCTTMNEQVREDFFMASRDRIRRNEVYSFIEDKLAKALKEHPGLQELNQKRRKEDIEHHLNKETPIDVFQKILKADSTLATLFAVGSRLSAGAGPAKPPSPFVGRKFPTFFRLKSPKEGATKGCPVNLAARVEFETDADNDYFTRADCPGTITIEPSLDLLEQNHLWNGRYETRFRVPWDAEVGTLIPFTVTVSDVYHINPFVCQFTLRADPEVADNPPEGSEEKPKAPNGRPPRTVFAEPNLCEVRKEEWEEYTPAFTLYESIRILRDGQGGYDYYLNLDNFFLKHQVANAKEDDKPLVRYWFTWGLVLASFGMLKEAERRMKDTVASNGEEDPENEGGGEDDLKRINHACNGLAQVIIPIIRTLYHGPKD